MNRRELISKSMTTSAAALTLGMTSKLHAMVEKEETYQIRVEISRNHNHDLQLKSDDLFELIRESYLNDTVSLDIQGSSRHPHLINLTTDQIIVLIAEGALEVTSSRDAGHTHDVNLTFENIEEGKGES